MNGSDSAQGPDWWKASDGKWYPPSGAPAGEQARTAPSSFDPSLRAGGAPAARSAGPFGIEGGSFFKRLFDVSFTSFITPGIIKVLYIIAVALVSIVSFVFLVAGFIALFAGDEVGFGVLVLILVPIGWLLSVIYWRVILELVVVFFRIERNTRRNN